MAFDLSLQGSYGSGTLGNVTDPSSPYINAYAFVEDIHTFNFLALPISNSAFVSWDDCVGEQVLLHCITAKSSNQSTIGRFVIATITDSQAEEGALRITVDTSTAYTGNNSEVAGYWQAILIPQFRNLTLRSQSVKPDPYSFSNTAIGAVDSGTAPCGGVLVFKCSETLTLAGGHVDLRDAGFPVNVSTTYRPSLSHETTGALDTDLHSGSENSIAKDRLVVNAGDGACLILAKQIICSSGSSRIGNPATSGVQYCRGASDSANTPANVSNVGGSTIALVTHAFSNFTPSLIAKYRSGSTGRGLARAYLAVLNARNEVKPDEGLYALDTIKNTSRLKDMCNLTGFGNAQDGSYTITAAKASKCWNSYAAVTAISGRVYTISKRTSDLDEVTSFAVGRLVMIHQSLNSSASDWEDGRFKLSRITAVSGSTVTIKHNFTFDLSKYSVQMVVIPEYNNLTINQVYNNALEYGRGCGGIFAIACAGTCNLSGATINMEGKGTFSRVVNPIVSNYSMKGALPLGQGNGSILIIANNLTMNSSTRLGGTYDGSNFGGTAVSHQTSIGAAVSNRTWSAQGGWKGADGSCAKYPDYAGTGGSGSAGGTCVDGATDGGWQSNARLINSDYNYGLHGSHILIIANSINGLNLSALSTGGQRGGPLGSFNAIENFIGTAGGCGYGGGGMSRLQYAASAWAYAGAGGYRGGGAGTYCSGIDYLGGGAGGSCFIYANTISNQSTTGIVLF